MRIVAWQYSTGHFERLRWCHLKRAVGLALGTSARLDFLLCVLVEWPQDETALGTIILHHLELRKDSCSSGHHSANAHQLVQMPIPETPNASQVLEKSMAYTLLISHKPNDPLAD